MYDEKSRKVPVDGLSRVYINAFLDGQIVPHVAHNRTETGKTPQKLGKPLCRT
jgi:hypothetical protein